MEEILKTLPEKPILDEETNRQAWKTWQHGLSMRITLPEKLPPLRMLFIWDNLQGHHTPELVLWLFAHGVMPLYTPLGGSWLNMAESIQRILVAEPYQGKIHKRPNKSLPGWKPWHGAGTKIQPLSNGVVREPPAENEVVLVDWLWVVRALVFAVPFGLN